MTTNTDKRDGLKKPHLYRTGKSSDAWRTPDRVFNNLHREFGFTIDAAASANNAKLPRFWSRHDDALRQDWGGERVFCNPPYSEIPQFLAKAPEADVSVMFVTSRTSNDYWIEHVWANPYCHEIRFVNRGVKFEPPALFHDHIEIMIGLPAEEARRRAPIPSVLLIFKNTPRIVEHRITVVDADTILPLVVVARGGKPGRPTIYNHTQLRQVIELSDAGLTQREITARTGIPQSTVSRIVQRLHQPSPAWPG